jgi:2-C-methyl-D-erythritol 4-phosphate cytidylyltransferase
MLDKIVLIVAAGAGTRMQNNVPKQFMPLRGKPVLMWTMQVFHDSDPFMKVIVVLPEAFIPVWEGLCQKYDFVIPHQKKVGGPTRFHSVKRGIEGLEKDCLVAVHDGVRPLVSMQTIDRCFEAASAYGSAIPCIEIPESLRKTVKGGSVHVDRSKYRLIQTPQVFKSSLLEKAYRQPYREQFTDDANVVESTGCKIHLVQGNPENIKITHMHDLAYAESILAGSTAH